MRGRRVLQRCEDVGGADQGRAEGGREESLRTTEVRHWKTRQEGESYMCLHSRPRMQSSSGIPSDQGRIFLPSMISSGETMPMRR